MSALRSLPGPDAGPVRVLVVPGLNDSGPTHWQTWLQGRCRHSVRVQQADWAQPDLDTWAARIDTTLAAQLPARWVAVAHSFGCLALLRHLHLHPTSPVRSALLVAPADPEKFNATTDLPPGPLAAPSLLIGSETDPWMDAEQARRLARRIGAGFINLGDAGHINVAAGFGPLPPAMAAVTQLTQCLERTRRIDRAHPLELSFAL